MKTAIDTSVLLSVFKAESDANAWLDRLVRARREGQLVVCDVVYAELTPAFSEHEELSKTLAKLGVAFEAVSPAAAWRAGHSFRAYRDAGGPREHLIADFLIAAHAEVQADRIAAVDRGYLRRYFADLPLLKA